MMSRPMKTHLYYPMIQFLIMSMIKTGIHRINQVLIGNCLYLTTDHMSLKTLSYCHKLHVQRGYKTGLTIQS